VQAASDSKQAPRAPGAACDARRALISIGRTVRSRFAPRASACGDANVHAFRLRGVCALNAKRRPRRRARRRLTAKGPFRGRRPFAPSVTRSDARSIQPARKNGETKRRTVVLAVFRERFEATLSTAQSSCNRATNARFRATSKLRTTKYDAVSSVDRRVNMDVLFKPKAKRIEKRPADCLVGVRWPRCIIRSDGVRPSAVSPRLNSHERPD
jgi:hypothetical protein